MNKKEEFIRKDNALLQQLLGTAVYYDYLSIAEQRHELALAYYAEKNKHIEEIITIIQKYDIDLQRDSPRSCFGIPRSKYVDMAEEISNKLY